MKKVQGCFQVQQNMNPDSPCPIPVEEDLQVNIPDWSKVAATLENCSQESRSRFVSFKNQASFEKSKNQQLSKPAHSSNSQHRYPAASSQVIPSTTAASFTASSKQLLNATTIDDSFSQNRQPRVKTVQLDLAVKSASRQRSVSSGSRSASKKKQKALNSTSLAVNFKKQPCAATITSSQIEQSEFEKFEKSLLQHAFIDELTNSSEQITNDYISFDLAFKRQSQSQLQTQPQSQLQSEFQLQPLPQSLAQFQPQQQHQQREQLKYPLQQQQQQQSNPAAKVEPAKSNKNLISVNKNSINNSQIEFVTQSHQIIPITKAFSNGNGVGQLPAYSNSAQQYLTKTAIVAKPTKAESVAEAYSSNFTATPSSSTSMSAQTTREHSRGIISFLSPVASRLEGDSAKRSNSNNQKGGMLLSQLMSKSEDRTLRSGSNSQQSFDIAPPIPPAAAVGRVSVKRHQEDSQYNFISEKTNILRKITGTYKFEDRFSSLEKSFSLVHQAQATNISQICSPLSFNRQINPQTSPRKSTTAIAPPPVAPKRSNGGATHASLRNSSEKQKREIISQISVQPSPRNSHKSQGGGGFSQQSIHFPLPMPLPLPHNRKIVKKHSEESQQSTGISSTTIIQHSSNNYNRATSTTPTASKPTQKELTTASSSATSSPFVPVLKYKPQYFTPLGKDEILDYIDAKRKV